MPAVWKGPGVLSGTGKLVYPGEPIPVDHVTPERLVELAGQIERVKLKVAPEPVEVPEPTPEPGDGEPYARELVGPKSKPRGRPPGSKNR